MLERAADLESLREAAAQHLPKLTESDDAWVFTREEQGWRALNGTTTAGRADVEQSHARVAEHALSSDALAAMKPIETSGHLCVPLVGGGEITGVLGVPESAGPFTNLRQRMIAAAAALTGLAIRNAQLAQHVRDHGARDPLTGCLTRANGVDHIVAELRRARRSQTPVSMIMFDVDHLKDINERRGLACGDAMLRAVGVRLRELLRGSDMRCRYGGEEFVVLLPETPIEGARRVADTLRKEIADLHVVWQDERVTATASFGVTVALPSEVDAQAIIARAEAALDRAKDQGTQLRSPDRRADRGVAPPSRRLSASPLHVQAHAYLAWIAVCLLWGTTYLGIRIALETDSAAADGRLALDRPPERCSSPCCAARRAAAGAARAWPALALLGVLLLGFGNGGVVWAEQTRAERADGGAGRDGRRSGWSASSASCRRRTRLTLRRVARPRRRLLRDRAAGVAGDSRGRGRARVPGRRAGDADRVRRLGDRLELRARAAARSSENVLATAAFEMLFGGICHARWRSAAHAASGRRWRSRRGRSAR